MERLSKNFSKFTHMRINCQVKYDKTVRIRFAGQRTYRYQESAPQASVTSNDRSALAQWLEGDVLGTAT